MARLRDGNGNLLPINEDGSVRYTPSTTRSSTGDGGNIGYVSGGGSVLGTIFYYLFKVLMMAVSLGVALVLAALMGNFSETLFGASDYTGLLGIIKDLLKSFFPLISLIVAGVAGVWFVAKAVDIDVWARAFFGPLVSLATFLGIGLVLFLFNLSLSHWWSFLIFIVGAGILLKLIGGRDD